MKRGGEGKGEEEENKEEKYEENKWVGYKHK